MSARELCMDGRQRNVVFLRKTGLYGIQPGANFELVKTTPHGIEQHSI